MSMDSIAGPVNIGTVTAGTLLLMFLTITTELITKILKQFIPKKIKEKVDFQFPLLISVIVGITLSFTFKMDIFRMFGFVAFYPNVAYVAIGLIAAGGSPWVHEYLSKLRASRADLKLLK